MAKREVAYHDIDTAKMSKPVKSAYEAMLDARKKLNDAVVSAAKKSGALPEGMYGKVYDKRYGEGIQLAVSDTEFPAGGGTKSTITI